MVGGKTDLETFENELNNLKKQLQIPKNNLNNANDDETLNYEFEVAKLKDDIKEVT